MPSSPLPLPLMPHARGINRLMLNLSDLKRSCPTLRTTSGVCVFTTSKATLSHALRFQLRSSDHLTFGGDWRPVTSNCRSMPSCNSSRVSTHLLCATLHKVPSCTKHKNEKEHKRTQHIAQGKPRSKIPEEEPAWLYWRKLYTHTN